MIIENDPKYMFRLQCRKGHTIIADAIEPVITRCLIEMGELHRRKITAIKFLRYEHGLSITESVEVYDAFKNYFNY